jgi:hypothetical protein
VFGWSGKGKVRRKQVREQRVRQAGTARTRLFSRVLSWPVMMTVVFVAVAVAIALLGNVGIEYAVGKRVDRPIHAQVDFQVPDAKQTAAGREAARAKTASHYTLNPKAITADRVRTDLMALYQAAADSETFEEYAKAMEQKKWPAEHEAYDALRSLVDQPEDAGRKKFVEWAETLPVQEQLVVRELYREPREPASATNFILVEMPDDGGTHEVKVPHSELVQQATDKALQGAASEVARRIPMPRLRSTVEAIVRAAFKEQPTIVFNQERTREAMRAAEESVPEVMVTYKPGDPLVNAGVSLGTADHELLRAHQAAYLAFLNQDVEEARAMRRERLLQRVGLGTLVGILAIGLMAYVGSHQPRIFEIRARTLAFLTVILGTLAAAQALVLQFPSIPELVLFPCLFVAMILGIAYPRRFAMGAMCIVCVIAATIIRAELLLLVTLFTGVAVVVFQLDDIRTRTKLINCGALTAGAIFVTASAGGLMEGQSPYYIWVHAGTASACAIFAAFFTSGLLPFIERTFRIATSLTLLEWRDPTKPLLQLLAREAPGTYNHSLVLGTLAEAACERIGANGLLAQVGALYHDIGKIHKSDYFTENQVGSTSRHENLAPTMSLLIILGHVKDGVEMAKEYKLPRVLHQFIEEHHGTTVVRYFHHMATEKRVAQGRHDREVPEAEFRYGGPKPRSRESAVLMLCDGVEGAVRSLNEPTVGRIESVVHSIVMDRLNDGQFDNCDITLREIRLVEESLVKSLCSLYHGRVAYPKKTEKVEKPEFKIATAQ